MNNDRLTITGRVIMLLTLFALAAGCATTKGGDDPLKYTKKLAAEGHTSLYNNGAFEVPNTKIKLIPPGPSTTELALEMMGLRAYQSFEKSVKQAAESVTVVSEGTQASYRFATDIHRGTDAIAGEIHSRAKESSTLLIYTSTDLGKQIIGSSWETAKHLLRSRPTAGPAVIKAGREAGNRMLDEGAAAGDRIVSGSRESGAAIIGEGSRAGDRIVSGSLESASAMSHASIDRSESAMRYAGRKFVKGYAAVPKRLKQRGSELGTSLTRMDPVAIVKENNEFRREWTGKAVDLVSMTVADYPRDATSSFKKAGQELTEGYRTTGLSLSVLRSLRWVLQGVLWDATIKPVTKVTAASLGYIGVNFVAFPSMVVVQEGVATTRLALDVAWDAAGTGYDIVAPTAIAAVAGVYGVADMAVSHTAAGLTAAGGPVLGYGEKAAAGLAGVAVIGGGTALGYGEKAAAGVARVAVKAGSYAAGQAVRTVEYIGVPLASAGITLGGGAIGTAVGAVGAAGSGVVFVSGEAAAATTQVFGNVIAGTTLAGGTAASAAGGAAYGVYELSKAVVVPAGYELGGGLALSYETLSQLGAHAILAVSDCAYMVLSLEGPRWVLYAVKGNTGKGEDLPAGAVVDLKQMQEQGEVIYNLPVSDQEMKRVVESVYDSLPETGTGEPR
ncbi:MAG: hypothetical protein ACYC7L_11190 [Nitrospirota bacterium]